MNAKQHSDDPSTQCGAVLIPDGPSGHRNTQVCFGVNHFPEGVKVTQARLDDRDMKLTFIEHAERDVIYKAALRGIATHNATLICPWFSCAPCARAIVSCGISRVIGYQRAMDHTPERWLESIAEGNVILDEAGVRRDYYTRSLFDDGFQILFDGELWTP
jgi:dCMP deaminase